MKIRAACSAGLILFLTACGSASKPATDPSPASAPAPASAPTDTAASSPAPAPAPAPSPAASSPAPAPAPAPDVVTTNVTAVSNEIATPNVVSPDKVIADLRPKLNACYQDGLKKDPKLAGSVTLSAKIEKDGKVSAVTPKLVEGLSPAVIKCLTEKVKAANFAPSGAMSYATSIDIPVRFASN